MVSSGGNWVIARGLKDRKESLHTSGGPTGYLCSATGWILAFILNADLNTLLCLVALKLKGTFPSIITNAFQCLFRKREDKRDHF